jgi:hypothetical protein
MSVTNLAVMFVIASGTRASVELVAGPAAAQNTATRLNNAVVRCTRGVATGSFILPSILSNEANEAIMLVNDTAGALNVYPWVGEKLGGTLNAAASVGAGTTGIFLPILNSSGNPTTLDWRPAIFT